MPELQPMIIGDRVLIPLRDGESEADAMRRITDAGIDAVSLGVMHAQVFEYSPGGDTEWKWNIWLAQQICSERSIDAHLTVSGVARFLTDKIIEVNTEHAMSDKIDLTLPIICVPIQLHNSDGSLFFSGLFPIDGWHRLYRAMQEGFRWLPAYVLTDAEDKLCQVP